MTKLQIMTEGYADVIPYYGNGLYVMLGSTVFNPYKEKLRKFWADEFCSYEIHNRDQHWMLYYHII